MVEFMKAVVAEGRKPMLARLPVPQVGPDEVLVQVEAAGICRTDLRLAEGRIAAPQHPLVLGHEFSGVVVKCGAQVEKLETGRRVAVFPWFGCGACAVCEERRDERCAQAQMLGWHRHGAFAQYVAVPARAVYPVADSVDFVGLAYAEPIAAALAIFEAGLQAHQRVLIGGQNRFSALARQLLQAKGIHQVDLADGDVHTEANAYDVAIETSAQPAVLSRLIVALKPGATLILKSRPAEPVLFDVGAAVRKEITCRGVFYGRFSDAVELIEKRQLDLGDLKGRVFPLDQFEQAFAEASGSEKQKIFLSPRA